ncbi:hypothetical protein [Rossellomorea vietnamensis]|jgi:hypothetical protein|uniref:hypothetical protein n=1 Tax=Rossellomorea vietnamensis TaxID=218284 RepID=UPI0009D28435|nr:hypothetical protein [Rossellomorea vietnamensis]PRX78940.1 hypothetical protein B0G93_102303 [Bacillus sp. V-88]SLK16005.1 hypothetical protein SAMN06295884_102303 [Bacillus sp. V-88]
MFNFYQEEMILKEKIRDMQKWIATQQAKSASSIHTKKIEGQICCSPCCPAV